MPSEGQTIRQLGWDFRKAAQIWDELKALARSHRDAHALDAIYMTGRKYDDFGVCFGPA
jgi:hypothetical protein